MTLDDTPVPSLNFFSYRQRARAEKAYAKCVTTRVQERKRWKGRFVQQYPEAQHSRQYDNALKALLDFECSYFTTLEILAREGPVRAAYAMPMAQEAVTDLSKLFKRGQYTAACELARELQYGFSDEGARHPYAQALGLKASGMREPFLQLVKCIEGIRGDRGKVGFSDRREAALQRFYERNPEYATLKAAAGR